MQDVKNPDYSRIAQDLQIRRVQVESVVQLLDESNTVPFITRYRKERTGGLNEELIRAIQSRVTHLRQLADRKITILKSIEGQGKLTDELRSAVEAAETSRRLEDLYLPYKPKKRSLATVARERGLEPLALAVWNRDPVAANLDEVLPTLVNPEKQLPSVEDVRQGVIHILAELIAETAEVRAATRSVLWATGGVTAAKNENLAENEGLEFKDYFKFTESARQIPPHRILAINRGEKEKALKAKLEWDGEGVRRAAIEKLPIADHPHAEFLKTALDDSLARLLLPSLEREIRRELTEEAEIHAVRVFARNLKSLLLQPPLHQRRVLAIDPGFRTGCKLAGLDEGGNLLEEAVIFPHAPQNKKADAKVKLEELVRKHRLNVVAIGNGTACRETEEVVSELIAELEKRRQGDLGQPAAGSGEPTAAGPALVTPVLAADPSSTPAETAVARPSLVTQVPAADSGSTPTEPASATSAAPSEATGATATTADATTPAMLQPADAAVAPTSAGPAPVVPASAPAAVVDPALPPAPPELAYVIVNEAGASVYSASAIGREEFPDYDATLRGTISIGRRLQDPLSELVKIDPQSIGVGLYQHDVSPKHLKESLDAVIESSVNHVGIDLNTASVPLLRHGSGLNQLAARDLVDYRKTNGPFKNREQLLQVPNIGPARYVQAAGFLKIVDGDNPLDRTWIHPESYPAAQQLLADLGYGPEVLADKQKTEELRAKLKSISPEEVAARLKLAPATVSDLMEALARPGRDPREDLPPPIFKKGILKLEDLQPAMELKGTVLNVVDFGAFVDIGLKDSGLVHISQMANRYIKNPYDVAAVGDVVAVWVLAVDKERSRVSLTMIKPGTERKPEERKPQAPRPQRSNRPPRGRRPPAQQQPRQPAPQNQSQTAATATAAPVAATPAPRPQPATPAPGPRPGQPPRKPKRQVPKPKLSQAAMERKVPLRSFSELEVFFENKEKKEPPPG